MIIYYFHEKKTKPPKPVQPDDKTTKPALDVDKRNDEQKNERIMKIIKRWRHATAIAFLLSSRSDIHTFAITNGVVASLSKIKLRSE